MRFEQVDSGETSVTFEVRTDVEFREQIVARDALGSFVHSVRGDTEARTKPAFLAVAINQLNGFGEEEEDGKKKPKETALDLSNEEISLLYGSLRHFVNDTPEAINSTLFSAAGAVGCAVRAVEADMAGEMIAELEKEFPELAVEVTPQAVGYAK